MEDCGGMIPDYFSLASPASLLEMDMSLSAEYLDDSSHISSPGLWHGFGLLWKVGALASCHAHLEHRHEAKFFFGSARPHETTMRHANDSGHDEEQDLMKGRLCYDCVLSFSVISKQKWQNQRYNTSDFFSFDLKGQPPALRSYGAARGHLFLRRAVTAGQNVVMVRSAPDMQRADSHFEAGISCQHGMAKCGESLREVCRLQNSTHKWNGRSTAATAQPYRLTFHIWTANS